MTKRLVLVFAILVLASGALLWRAQSGRATIPRTATSSASRATGIVPPTAEPASADGLGGEREAPAALVQSGLYGRVIDDRTGMGVPDAELAVHDYAAGSAERARTDAEGRFSVPARPGCAYRLSVSSPSYAALTLRVVDTAAAPLTLRLDKGAALAGSVVDPDGKPVRTARLALVRPPAPDESVDEHSDLFEQSVPEDLRYDARTVATDGRFAFPRLRPGAVVLLVTAPGFAPAIHEVGEPLVAGEQREIVVPILREAPVRVRVVDAQSGETLRGVRFVPELTRGRQAYPLAEAKAREPEAGLYEVDVALRKDGQLATTQLRVERDGYPPQFLDFSGFDVGHTFRLVMGRSGHLAGTVHDPDAAVILVSRSMDGRLLARAQVDAKGRFTTGPLPGKDDLHVYVYDASLRRVLGYASARLRYGETRTLAFGAPDRPALIAVLRRDGKPARQSILSLAAGGRPTVVSAGQDGCFRFDNLEPGRYRFFANLYLDDPVFLTRFVEVGDEPVRVELDARFTVEGRVVSAETGAPITGNRHDVEARLIGGSAADGLDKTRLREDGTFTLRLTRPGTWELNLPRLRVDERPRVVVSEDGTPLQTEIAVRQDPEDRVVSLRVLDDPTGNLVASGSYHYEGGGAVRLTGGHVFQAGEAKIKELQRGTYRIVLGARGYVATEIEVSVGHHDRELRRTVRLKRANAVLVAEVMDGGAAKPAGVRAGDVLMRYGAERVRNLAELKQALKAASGTVAVELWRDGKPVVLSLPAGRLGAQVANHRIEE